MTCCDVLLAILKPFAGLVSMFVKTIVKAVFF